MFHRITLSLLFIVFSMSVQAKKVYKIGISSSCPYYCTDGEKKGYIVDILNIFFKKYKIDILFETTPYSRLTNCLDIGTKDFAILTSYDLRDASNFFISDVTLGVSSAGILSKVGTDSVILDIKDLKEKTVSIVPGSKAIERLYSQIQDINTNKSLTQFVSGTDIHNRLINLVSLGRTDYAIEDYNVLKYFNSKNGIKDKMVLTPSSILGHSPLIFVGRKDLPIQRIIEQNFKPFIKEFRKSGKLKALLQQYNIADWNMNLSR